MVVRNRQLIIPDPLAEQKNRFVTVAKPVIPPKPPLPKENLKEDLDQVKLTLEEIKKTTSNISKSGINQQIEDLKTTIFELKDKIPDASAVQIEKEASQVEETLNNIKKEKSNTKIHKKINVLEKSLEDIKTLIVSKNTDNSTVNSNNDKKTVELEKSVEELKTLILTKNSTSEETKFKKELKTLEKKFKKSEQEKAKLIDKSTDIEQFNKKIEEANKEKLRLQEEIKQKEVNDKIKEAEDTEKEARMRQEFEIIKQEKEYKEEQTRLEMEAMKKQLETAEKEKKILEDKLIMSQLPVAADKPEVPKIDKKAQVNELNKTVKNSPSDKFVFYGVLLTAYEATQNGNIYTKEVLQKICDRLNQRPFIILQEMNEVERKIKKIPLAEPWLDKVMGHITKSEMQGNHLIFQATCLANKHGKKLEGVIKSVGAENLDFVPIGYGTVNDKKVINSNYKINYVSVEPK